MLRWALLFLIVALVAAAFQDHREPDGMSGACKHGRGREGRGPLPAGRWLPGDVFQSRAEVGERYGGEADEIRSGGPRSCELAHGQSYTS